MSALRAQHGRVGRASWWFQSEGSEDVTVFVNVPVVSVGQVDAMSSDGAYTGVQPLTMQPRRLPSPIPRIARARSSNRGMIAASESAACTAGSGRRLTVIVCRCGTLIPISEQASLRRSSARLGSSSACKRPDSSLTNGSRSIRFARREHHQCRPGRHRDRQHGLSSVQRHRGSVRSAHAPPMVDLLTAANRGNLDSELLPK